MSTLGIVRSDPVAEALAQRLADLDLPITVGDEAPGGVLAQAVTSGGAALRDALDAGGPAVAVPAPPVGWLLGKRCGASGTPVIALLESGSEGEAERLRRTIELWTADLERSGEDASTLELFSDELSRAFEQITLLFRLARLVNTTGAVAEVVQALAWQIQAMLPYAWVSIAFDDSPRVLPDLRGRVIRAGAVPADEPTFERIARAGVASARTDDWTKVLEPSRDPLARLVSSMVVAEPIPHDGQTIGLLMAGNKPAEDPDPHSCETQFLDATAEFLGVYHENATRFAEQRAMFLGTLTAITAAIDAKDPYTRGHSERVAHLGRQLAEKLRLPPEDIERIYVAGLVHDVGKIGVPEAVLCKPSRLTDEEFTHIRKHPEIGHRILCGIPPLEPMLPGVLQHHERWDGRGYPHRVAGTEVHLYGRILALADTFDAMSSNRAYRPAMSRDRVLEEIRNCAGTQFDPDLAPIFAAMDFTEFDHLLRLHQAQHQSAIAA